MKQSETHPAGPEGRDASGEGAMASRLPALEARSLEVPFGGKPGLSGVSFEVARGERFALVGASGAGKTSLLRALSGSGPVVGGSVLVEGKDVAGLSPGERGMVLLSQRPLLFPHLSVFENVAFPLRVRKASRAGLEERVEEALAAVRMEGFGARRPQSLSGGQAHRIALARAVVARPPILLLDEPLASLDPSLREDVRQAILAVQREYRPALVLVTHDLQEAGRMGDRIGVLLEGSLAQTASPDVLFRHPASAAVARFLGLPNALPGKRSHDGGLILGGWRVSGPGMDPPAAPAPDVEGRPVDLVFGADAGHLLPRGSGGIPARVEEIRHHPEGAVGRITLMCEKPYLGRIVCETNTSFAGGSGGEALFPGSRGAGGPSRGLSCLVSLDPGHPPLSGEELEVVFDPSRMHVFE